MNLQNKIITVFGATGFVGRYIVSRLAKHGATIKVVTRSPSSGYFLRQYGSVGQIVPVSCDYSEASIHQAVSGSDVVINCLGILFEKGKSKFKTVHVDDAAMIAQACAMYKVSRLVHISALGIDESKSRYAETKREGEKQVRSHFPAATIIRPSVIFGPEDNFFNKFASLSLISPVLPLIAGGNTKFQPVYVGDVADAIVKTVVMDGTAGQVFELGGPEVLSFKDIYQKIFVQTGRKRILVNLPESIARIKAAFLSILPNPPLTGDQITSLKTDNIISADAKTLTDLDISPTALDAILPVYLGRYRSGGRFAEKKRA